MVVPPPKIDQRDQQMLVEQVRNLMIQYCPEWKDESYIRSDKHTDALIHIFSRMMEITIQRLNKVPDKNFLTFLDLIGVRLIPPRVAQAPLIFTLAKGTSKYGFVPPRTQIATAKTKEKESVVFETDKPLTVISPRIIRAAAISPVEDKWTDYSQILVSKAKEDVSLFRGQSPVPHRLYLGHSKLFGFKEKANISLQITTRETMPDEQEVEWYYYKKGSIDPVPLEVTESVNPSVKNLLISGTLTFSNVEGIDERELKGFEDGTYEKKTWKSNWIYAQLKKPLTGGRLPAIGTIRAGIMITPESPVPIDLAYFNNIPIDISRDFYPFGEKPKFNDTFYFGSRTAFSKEGANIEITVTLSGEKPDTGNIKLLWEFWDGSGWGKLGETAFKDNSATVVSGMDYAFSDTTKAFREAGKITFKCPEIKAAKIKEISADENCWIRIRINDGNYGEEATYEQGKTAGSWEYKKPTYKPPIIGSMVLGYQFTPAGKKIEIVLSYNDFFYHDQTLSCNNEKTYFNPFSKVTDEHQSLYLGFDDSPATLPVTIFFPLLEKRAGSKRTPVLADGTGIISASDVNITGKATIFTRELKTGDIIKCSGQERTIETINSDTSMIIDSPFDPQVEKDSKFSYFTFASIVWEYWTKEGWSELKVEDGTKNMTKREIVQFLTPYDIEKKPGFGFEEECYWIRAKLAKGQYEEFPRLRGIYTNTVWAYNRITVENEHLGSSNGKPDQVFKFSLSPVLEQKIRIREVSLTENEKHTVIEEEKNKDAIEDIRDDKGNVTGYWVRWHEVEHFYFSKPDSRHYVIDSSNGKIIFGDGERGKIPPAGRDNINSSYLSGGGIKGNVEEGTITKLRTSLPYIDSVTNPEPADGGGDQEDLDRVRERGPQTLKHRDRAVTYEDFEWLVREASPKVAKVKCLPTRDTSLKFEPGWVTLIIVPESKDPKPLPSRELINTIENYIFSRTSTYLTTNPSQVNLIGPGYIQVMIEASVQFESIAEAKAIEGRIINNLNEFLHPLRGGPDKKGWDFGRNVYISEVYEVIENTDGVDHVDDLIIKANVQIYKFILKEKSSQKSGIKLKFSCPKGSRVESIDEKIVFSLAEDLSQGDIDSLNVSGFREGDHITLRDGKKSSSILINSVRKNAGYDILGFEAASLDNVFPENSIAETSDKRVRSFLVEEVADKNTAEIRVAKFDKGDEIVLKHRDYPSRTEEAVIDSVIESIETVFIGDNYLVYSGPHSINKKVG